MKYRAHETTQDAQLRRAIGGNLPLATLSGGPTPGDFLDGLGVSADLSNWITVDEGGLQDFFNNLPPSGFIDATYFDFLSQQFEVEEDIWAGYAQLDFGNEIFRGNIGLRYVDTTQRSFGRVDTLGGQFGPPAIPASRVQDVEFSSSYNDWLPSANFAIDLSESVVLRVAASRVIARPNYSDLSTNLVTNNTLLTASGGNPNLSPYRATNIDGSVEWYLGPSQLLAFTAFYKDIGNYIVRTSAVETLFNPETGTINPDGPDFDDYTVTRPRNGGGAELRGVELIYQGDVWEEFGLQASYTFSDSRTESAAVLLPFSSKHSFTLTPYFENDFLSARVTYSYRSEYFREINRATSVFNDGYSQLDAAFTVFLTDQIALTAQAQNLLDETQYQYVESEDIPFASYKNGRRYFFGARYTY